jgi:diguanylate cyclase (GGDEF)-like protein/PAS domain S-box-containing protein
LRTARLPRSLLGQLAVLLLVVLPLMWLAIASNLERLRQQSLDAAAVETGNLTRVFAEEVHSSVHAIDLTLLDLRERWLEEPQQFREKVRLRRAYLESDVAFQVSIIDAHGQLQFTSATPNAKPMDLHDREHFRFHLEHPGDQLFISKPVLGRISRRWSLQFTRPMYSASQQFLGVIVVSVSPDYFTRFSRRIDLGPGATMTVIRSGGEVIARMPSVPASLELTLTGTPFVNARAGGAGVFFQVSRVDGVYRQFAWRSLEHLPLVVTIGRSVDGVLARYRQQRTVHLGAGVALSILIALLGYLLLSSRRQRVSARRELEQSEFRWKHALEGAGEGVWDWNPRNNELFLSRQWKEMLGYAEHEIENRIEAWEALVHPEDKPRVLAEVGDYAAGRSEVHSLEYRLRCKDDQWKWVHSRGLVVSRSPEGEPLRIIGTHADITPRKHAEIAELEYQRDYDALTGVASRTLLRERAEQALARARARTRPVWIACLNIDRFKLVNDTLGHEAGDLLLQLVARRLTAAVRNPDTVARSAGDEFILVLASAQDDHEVMAMVQHVMAALAQPFTIRGQNYFLTCSIGLAAFPADGDDAERLVKYAGLAMHRAKEVGRNSFQFYNPAMRERTVEHLQLEGDLRHALERNEFVLHYQPQVDLRTGRIVGMEALIRWNHPTLGLLSPGRFIQIAEETGLIVPIGTWVLLAACHQTKAWLAMGLGPLRIGVNVSGNQFYQHDLISSVKEALDASGLDAACLDLELSEGLVMTDVAQARETMHGLKRLGVSLSIDDFGTGYSSLSYLNSFPMDVLKIDQSFVRNIATSPEDATLARSIISLSQSLQLKVIAEGVETEEQLGYLRRHRCDEIQGFYFSRPLPAHEFEQMLVAGHRLQHPDPTDKDGQQTLLIVDDEQNVRTALQRMLRRDGYRILLAASASEALVLMACNDIQVVLSDHLMPDMTGIELLVKVKELYPHTIRMMLSGYTAIDSIIDATNTGAVFRFHTKPWDDLTLRQSIAEAFRYHWLIARP